MTTDFQLRNDEWLSWINSGQTEKAADAVNDYTREKLYEDGFSEKILPRVDLPDSELDPAIEHDFPRKIVHRQPEAPGAVSVPFGEFPQHFQLYGAKYEVTCRRVQTQRAQKDIQQLSTYPYDLRQVVSDIQGKEIQAEEDRALIAGTKAALIAPGAVTPWSGIVQHQIFNTPITRESIVDAVRTVMQATDASLGPKVVLQNVITYAAFFKMRRDEMGGDLSQKALETGEIDENLHGVRWIGTIKKKIVANNIWYMYAAPQFLGKSFSREPVTMWLKREAYMIEYFFYECYGATFGVTAGIAGVTFNG